MKEFAAMVKEKLVEAVKWLFQKPLQLYAVLLTIFLIIGSVFGYQAYKAVKKSYQNIKSKFEHSLTKTIPEKRIGPGTIVPKVDTVSRSEFNKLLAESSSKDAKIKQLIKELSSKKYEVITKTETKIKVITKVVYKDRPSDSVSGGVYSKTLLSEGLHIGDIQFNTGDLSKPWSYKLYPLKLKLQIFQTVNRGRPDRVGIAARLIDHKGKIISATIESSSTIYSYPEGDKPKWELSVRPFRIELGAYGGVNSSSLQFTGGFGVSTHLLKLRYGQQDVFRFLGLTLGFTSPAHAMMLVNPISWNIGSIAPGISDLYLTTGVGMAIGASAIPQFIFMIGIGTTI